MGTECFEPSQPHRVISGLTHTQLVSWCFEPSQPHMVISGLTHTQLVSWCFEPSQPHMAISGLTQTHTQLVGALSPVYHIGLYQG